MWDIHRGTGRGGLVTRLRDRRGTDISLLADLAADLRVWLTDELQRIQPAESDADAPSRARDLPVFQVSSQLHTILKRDLKLAVVLAIMFEFDRRILKTNGLVD